MTNSELADKLRQLRDFLIIAGYEESHAFRYTHIARTIERMPESVEEMSREHRLTEIPQVGKLIAVYIREIIQTGASSKQHEWEEHAPFSVVEMCQVKGLGPKTAQNLYRSLGITSLRQLQDTVRSGSPETGLSPALKEAVLQYRDPN